jgi:tRNA-dihydrouridine synthase B
LTDGKLLPETSVPEQIEMALAHAHLMVEHYGQRLGALKMRKHLAWYSKGFSGGTELRRRLKHVESYADIKSLLDAYLDGSLMATDQPED